MSPLAFYHFHHAQIQRAAQSLSHQVNNYVASTSSLYDLLRTYFSHPAEAKNCRHLPLIFHSSSSPSSSSSVVISQVRRTLPTELSTHDFLKPLALIKHITYRERTHLSALKVQHMQKARMNFPLTPKKEEKIAPIRPSVLRGKIASQVLLYLSQENQFPIAKQEPSLKCLSNTAAFRYLLARDHCSSQPRPSENSSKSISGHATLTTPSEANRRNIIIIIIISSQFSPRTRYCCNSYLAVSG